MTDLKEWLLLFSFFPLFKHWGDSISEELARFRPQEVVYHHRDLVVEGVTAPPTEELISRPQQLVVTGALSRI